jgi:hypothetical protein
MDNVEPAPPAPVSRTRHWPIFLLGMLLILLGPVAYAVQINAKHLTTPWYVPILASIGVALMIVSIWRRRGVVRLILLVFFALVCGLEWQMLLVAFRSSVYHGPAQPGRAVPEFKASYADGTPFTEKDLSKGTATVLVFYRGRW